MSPHWPLSRSRAVEAARNLDARHGRGLGMQCRPKKRQVRETRAPWLASVSIYARCYTCPAPRRRRSTVIRNGPKSCTLLLGKFWGRCAWPRPCTRTFLGRFRHPSVGSWSFSKGYPRSQPLDAKRCLTSFDYIRCCETHFAPGAVFAQYQTVERP